MSSEGDYVNDPWLAVREMVLASGPWAWFWVPFFMVWLYAPPILLVEWFWPQAWRGVL